MRKITDTILQKIWHKWLRRPYRLACITDVGNGVSVVLLHGLGRHAGVWKYLIDLLRGRPYRVLAFDLLGFGASPKPDWLDYDVDNHADAVIASLRQRKVKGPVIMVGHSMGCLVAVRVARLRPDLIKHLVLYEMPLYAGLPEMRRFRLRLDFYFRLYKRIIRYQPVFDAKNTRIGLQVAEKIMGVKMTSEVWRAFVKSLEHTIMRQKTKEDLKLIAMPIDVIYGSLDQLVIRGKTQLLFGEDAINITAHTIRESHRISPKASKFLAERIEAAATNSTQDEIKAGKPLYRELVGIDAKNTK